MKDKAIIVGAGTYGQVYSEYLNIEYDIVGFIDDDKNLIGKEVNGIKVLGNFKHLLEKIDKSIAVFIPIGNNEVRGRLLNQMELSGFSTPSFIHSSVEIHPTVYLGKAVYVLPNSSIMPFSFIENHVMISMGVNIAHHTHIEEGVFLSQGVNVGASILLKKSAFIGIGATIMTGVKEIGAYSLIGAGSVIIQDVPDYAVVVGNPGKVIKYSQVK
ncbi:MAG TPA: acetyltransferase [Brumimicrobium sp.]|nr:acetyltransferase [Brumimicrobium sp.]